MRRLAPNLRGAGYELDFDRAGRDGRRIILLSRRTANNRQNRQNRQPGNGNAAVSTTHTAPVADGRNDGSAPNADGLALELNARNASETDESDATDGSARITETDSDLEVF